MRLSIVIPTWNEVRYLGRTLASLRAIDAEIVCVDGGSTDGTPELAGTFGVSVVRSPRGRGAQLGHGVPATCGDVLWFLHADTVVDCDAAGQIAQACLDRRVVGGNFRLIFDGRTCGARFLNHLYPWLARIGLRYGDSGIFARRAAYEASGGFRALPIFEDIDLLRRLTRLGALETLAGPLRTSSRRFEDRHFAPVFLRWTMLQVLYWMGCDPHWLGRIYYPDADWPEKSPGFGSTGNRTR
ncbi:MAG TPA: TIGR04283 family arsenosugar biosynthesis glycosyltransferase [Opitutaceae bacterium]